MLFGVDISHYQDGLDLTEVAAHGIHYVAAKVSEGDTYQDASWPAFRDAARGCGLVLVGYHYVIAGVDPGAQADTFVGHLGDKTIPAMLDFEANSGGIDVFWAVLDAIEARGVRVRLSYIPRWYWQQIGSPSLVGVPGLVASGYPSTTAGLPEQLYASVTDKYWAPYGGVTPAVLQFTDSATVGSWPSGVDANAFQGAPADFASLLGVSQRKRRNLMQQLPATPIPSDANSDPSAWPQRNYDVGFVGSYSFAFGCQEWPGRSTDPTRGFLYLASWILSDGSLTPVDQVFTTGGKGHTIHDHWPTPAYTAPAKAVGLTLNYAAPGGAYVAES